MWLRYILPGINAIVSFITIVALLIRSRKNAIERSYILLSVFWLNWSVGIILTMKWGFTAFGEYLYWIKNISAFAMGPLWLIFSLNYTNSRIIRNNKWKMINLFLMVVPPLIMYTISITNKYHGAFLVYDYVRLRVTGYNWGFWVHMTLQYIYILVGCCLILVHGMRSRSYIRKRSFIIVGGTLFTQFIIIGYYLSGIYLIYNDIDIAPSVFLIVMISILIASLKYKFLNLLPMALPKIMQNLREGIMIVDLEGKISNYNTAFCNMFNDYINVIGIDAKEFSEELRNNCLCDANGEKAVIAIYEGGYKGIKGEVSLTTELFFQINYQPLFDKNEFMGSVVSFYDISEHKSLMKQLNEKNDRLSEANTRLREHAKVVEELGIAQERNKFASEIHDSVGHSLSVLGALLEVCRLTFSEDPRKSYEKVEIALNISKKALYELRLSVVNFTSPSVKGETLLESLESMIRCFEETGIKVDFTIHGNINYPLDKETSNAVFNICREALTNSLKHGNAKTISIILNIKNSNLVLFIFDDGKGCSNPIKGIGLNGMENRVKALNGDIAFGSGGETGFGIHVEIPLSN